jgi:hypothetical protein
MSAGRAGDSAHATAGRVDGQVWRPALLAYGIYWMVMEVAAA